MRSPGEKAAETERLSFFAPLAYRDAVARIAERNGEGVTPADVLRTALEDFLLAEGEIDEGLPIRKLRRLPADVVPLPTPVETDQALRPRGYSEASGM